MPDLVKPIALYRQRFGHGPPASLLKDYAQGFAEAESILKPLNEALRTGRPVKEWAEYQPPPDTIEAMFPDSDPDSATPTPSSSRSPSSED